MKQLFLCLIAILSFSSCSVKTEVSGTLTTETRQVGDFSEISVSNGITLNITKGTKGDVTVRTFTSVFDYVETYVANNTLVIKIMDNVSFDRSPNLSVALPAEMIKRINLSGGSSVKSKDKNSFVADDVVNLLLSDGSSFNSTLTTDSLNVQLNGGSSVTLSGTTRNTLFNCSGGSSVDGKNFETDSVSVTLGGGSTIWCKVKTKINRVVLSGGSRFFYVGPSVDMGVVSKDQSSKIEKLDKF